ncbi:MAG: pilus assembly protein PilZ, partial [Anaeromyxobacteraceae bacterium]
MSPAGATTASRVLVVGSDADVTIALHLHLDRAGYAVYCMPGPEDLDPIARVVTPSILVLILPAQPDATWGAALTTAATAARAGVMVVMVAPQRDV